MDKYFLGLPLGNWFDFIGALITMLSVILVIKHYNNDNRKNLKLYLTITNNVSHSSENVVFFGNPTQLIIKCYNSGKVPVSLEFKGITILKNNWWHRLWRKISTYHYIPSFIKYKNDNNIKSLMFSPGEVEGKDKIITILPHEFIDVYTCKLKRLKNFADNNNINPNKKEDIYFCLKEIEGKYYYYKIKLY